MIPNNIRKEHVLKAIAEIDNKGIPERRGSTRYELALDGKSYPPKYLITIANRYANGREWPSDRFNGGWETNTFLSRMGFKIRKKSRSHEVASERGGPAGQSVPSENGDEEEDVAEAALDFSFSFEADLRDHLASHLDELEDGLVLFRQGDVAGVEYVTDVGRIDLLAVDPRGDFVVIELKRIGSDRATGQLLRYMGWVKRVLAGDRGVRGLIVTREADERLRYSVSVLSNVKIKEYEISFSFRDAGLE